MATREVVVRSWPRLDVLSPTPSELYPATDNPDLLEINLNSLTLARIHEAIEREFPQRIEVTDLFDYPTLHQLADFLDSTSS